MSLSHSSQHKTMAQHTVCVSLARNVLFDSQGFLTKPSFFHHFKMIDKFSNVSSSDGNIAAADGPR